MGKLRSRGVQRHDLRYVFLALLVFTYLLSLTAVRLSYRERSGRIEVLERTLKERRTDEVYLGTEWRRACGHLIVQRVAQQEWGMDVASADQHLLLAAGQPVTVPEDAGRAGNLWSHLLSIVPPGVAQARPAGEGGERVARTK